MLTNEKINYHLKLGADWIFRAQDSQNDGGVSCGYYIILGWRASYPETTGYTIPTLLNYENLTKDDRVLDRAKRMIQFLLKVQSKEGWFPGSMVSAKPMPSVFNSGMIIDGLFHYYKRFGDQEVLDSAVRASDWICRVQQSDGSWSKYNYREIARTYNSEVCASLAQLYTVTNSENYKKAVESGIDWVINQQQDNGWFQNCDNSVKLNDRPLTHVIGYTVRGLLVCGKILNHDTYIQSAKKCLDVMIGNYPMHAGVLFHGRFDSQWKPQMGGICVTGCAQLAISLFLLNRIKPNEIYPKYAKWINEGIAKIQPASTSVNGWLGGLPSSYPMWGSYRPFLFNNWGIKYFMDSLMLDLESK